MTWSILGNTVPTFIYFHTPPLSLSLHSFFISNTAHFWIWLYKYSAEYPRPHSTWDSPVCYLYSGTGNIPTFSANPTSINYQYHHSFMRSRLKMHAINSSCTKYRWKTQHTGQTYRPNNICDTLKCMYHDLLCKNLLTIYSFKICLLILISFLFIELLQRKHRELPFSSYPVSSILSMLYNHSPFVTTKKINLETCY